MNYRLIVAMVIVVQVSGCSDLARWVRQYTYPPELRYVERDEVRGVMRVLAAHSRDLNQLLRQDDAPQEHRAEIIEHLRAMEVAAGKLDQSGWSTNHPKVDMNLPLFRRDLKFAREAVEQDPPNFLLAGNVTGACAYCHGGK
jgi:hypothetical protein